MLSRKYDYTFKTIVVGDSGVGKTCLLVKYVRDIFDEEQLPTLGVEFLTKVVTCGEHRVQLQLWDTAGQELFRSVTRGYYRGSTGAFLVFDVTSSESFDSVGRWFQDVKEASRSDVMTVLIGNKIDKTEERKVTKEQAEDFANKNGMIYFETSAKTGDNVVNAIEALVSKIMEGVAAGTYEIPQVNDTESYAPEPQEKKGCCS